MPPMPDRSRQAKIEAVVETPEVKQLKVQYDAAVTELARIENELGSIEGEMLRLTNEREGRFGGGLLTPGTRGRDRRDPEDEGHQEEPS